MATFTDLYLDRGASFSKILAITDDVTGLGSNVSNTVLTCQMRKSYYSVNASANIECSILDGNNGVIQLALTSSNTSNLEPGRYVFDVKATPNTNPSYSTWRLLEGTITVTPSVTR